MMQDKWDSKQNQNRASSQVADGIETKIRKRELKEKEIREEDEDKITNNDGSQILINLESDTDSWEELTKKMEEAVTSSSIEFALRIEMEKKRKPSLQELQDFQNKNGIPCITEDDIIDPSKLIILWYESIRICK